MHNITNYVVMNLTANALLAVGASPVMAHALEEVEEMTGLASALVLNLGTLSPAWVEAMERAGRAAQAKGIPIILDPVGAGATAYRTTSALRLLDKVSPQILRGNASEIRALSRMTGGTKGVDAAHAVESVIEDARALSSRWNCVVSVSGPSDLIVAGERMAWCRNGDPAMGRITGMGCTSSALTGAFAAVEPDCFMAATGAMALMGVAGELAAQKSRSPGSFQVAFLDALGEIRSADFGSLIRVEHVTS